MNVQVPTFELSNQKQKLRSMKNTITFNDKEFEFSIVSILPAGYGHNKIR
jgi:hypothetical protein